MKNRIAFGILIAAALAAAAFGIWRFPSDGERGAGDVGISSEAVAVRHARDGGSPESVSPKPISALPFIELKQFEKSWAAAESAKALAGEPVAGVVNHHFLAADLMARFFRTLRLSRPGIKRFIVISPDHFRAGRGPVSVTDRAYTAPDGVVATASSSVKTLVASGFATLEGGEMFELEHGVGALVPFIRHEFPAAEIVPIAVRGDIDRQTAMDFGQVAVDIFDSSTFILVSSDMSHYLSEAQALKNDEETLVALASLDAGFLSKATDDFVDNGVGLLVAKTVFGKGGKRSKFVLLDHSISSRYVADKASTTSYINGIWIK